MSHEHSNIDNAVNSSIIGGVVTFLLNEVVPWALHTFSAILSAVTVAVVVYHFNKWLKKRDAKDN